MAVGITSHNSNDDYGCGEERKHYPFSGIVGQDDLKLCLILNAIDPTIGGVLIRGEKGTAKSTAARGLAKLLPPISVARDSISGVLDPYNRAPTISSSSSPSNDDAFSEVPTPFVDLPIGATEDRVLGSIDVSATLREGGRPVFAPGLLAACNRGILYIDEVNLLPAHLVDVLLDAAASGINTLQREGLSVTHPSRFVLVGTMNPEEGDLRPQLTDRFGLMCDVRAPRHVGVRSSVVKQRIAFEADPSRFCELWKDEEAEIQQRIQEARRLLPAVVVSERFVDAISQICIEFGVASLRADIAMYKTAAALAAWHGRTAVESDDIKQAAEWVLAHRKQRNPFDAPPPPPPPAKDDPNPEDDLMDKILNAPPPKTDNEENDPNPHQPEESEGDSHEDQDACDGEPDTNDKSNDEANNDDGDGNLQTFTASKPNQIKQLRLGKSQIKGRAGTGRRNTLPSHQASRKGHYVRSVPTDQPVDLALDATLRSAAVNGLDAETGAPIIRPENYRRKVRHSTTETLVLFVVDASGSMSARKRMETVKGAVLALLTDAYQQRDRVGVIAFRGVRAEVLLSPTQSVERAEDQLRRLSTGGRTPLAHALFLAHNTIDRVCFRNNDSDLSVLLIVLSDGKANVPLPPGEAESVTGDAWSQTVQLAGKLASLAVPTLFLDTDAGQVRVGRGKELAELLCADYLRLEDLSADGLVHTIREIKR